MYIDRTANKVDIILDSSEECDAVERALYAYIKNFHADTIRHVRSSEGQERMKRNMKRDKPIIEQLLNGLKKQ